MSGSFKLPTVPLLVWTVSSEMTAPADPDNVTLWNSSPSRPRVGNPLVFELRKGESKANAFAMEVTVGRILTNDIVIDDGTVSRFHAYFRQEYRTGAWQLIDACSSNGTAVNQKKISPEEAAVVADGAKITFGSVETIFYLPQSFLARLKSEAG